MEIIVIIVGSIVVSAVPAWFLWWIAKRARLGWGFWLLWVLASTVGWVIGFWVGYFVGAVVEEILPNYGNAGLVAGVGAGVGILQWLVLRRRVSRSGWWVLASILGLAVAGVVGTGVALAVGYSGLPENFAVVAGVGYSALPENFAVVAGVGGAMAGLMQWLVLRRQVSRAGWWVLASTVGWAVWGLVAQALMLGFLTLGVGLAGSGVGLGAVTGLALVWLLRQPAKEA